MQKNTSESDSKAVRLKTHNGGRGYPPTEVGKVPAKGYGMDKFTGKYPGNYAMGHLTPRNVAATPLLLHVDDDPDVAFLLERALRVNRMGHWRFLYRSSGREALEYLQQSMACKAPVPSLLALDIKMPGMGGLEVLEWVNTNIPAMPAVILSSSGLLEDRLRARDLGSKGYFEKSAVFSEFMEFLRDGESFRFGYQNESFASERVCVTA